MFTNKLYNILIVKTSGTLLNILLIIIILGSLFDIPFSLKISIKSFLKKISYLGYIRLLNYLKNIFFYSF